MAAIALQPWHASRGACTRCGTWSLNPGPGRYWPWLRRKRKPSNPPGDCCALPRRCSGSNSNRPRHTKKCYGRPNRCHHRNPVQGYDQPQGDGGRYSSVPTGDATTAGRCCILTGNGTSSTRYRARWMVTTAASILSRRVRHATLQRATARRWSLSRRRRCSSLLPKPTLSGGKVGHLHRPGRGTR
jgi:hypothetical protein